jgi:hypothetical protein
MQIRKLAKRMRWNSFKILADAMAKFRGKPEGIRRNSWREWFMM